MFTYQVVIEGVEGESGTGYSKKESQQQASKLTLQRLRKNPQFIDAVFAAKASRTKMEEEPVLVVPDTEQKEDFFKGDAVKEREMVKDEAPQQDPEPQQDSFVDEFDLSDITAEPKELSREEIIAAAEAAAFAEQ